MFGFAKRYQMGKISFQNYGIMTEYGGDYTYLAGRYLSQKTEERHIIPDVIKKLEINSKDNCLDIGCGPGNLLIPLSFLVKSITGIDHPNCISTLKKRFTGDNVRFVTKNFLECQKNELNYFNKILVYSVLHYLSDFQEVTEFINKAIALLEPGGKILLGDIPNVSLKKRFLDSEFGKKFNAKWQNQIPDRQQTNTPKYDIDNNLVEFTDTVIVTIMSTLREQGYNTYILPQPHTLPFCYTREDILIEKPK